MQMNETKYLNLEEKDVKNVQCYLACLPWWYSVHNAMCQEVLGWSRILFTFTVNIYSPDTGDTPLQF